MHTDLGTGVVSPEIKCAALGRHLMLLIRVLDENRFRGGILENSPEFRERNALNVQRCGLEGLWVLWDFHIIGCVVRHARVACCLCSLVTTPGHDDSSHSQSKLKKLGGCQLPAVQVQCILFVNSRYTLRSHRTMRPENQETITRLPVITIRPPILRIERQESITCV